MTYKTPVEDENLRLLVASVVDYAIIQLSADGTVQTWNDGAERIKGYKPDEIIGKNFSRFYTDEDNALGRPAQHLQDAIRHGRYEEIGWRLRKNGELFYANVIITALRDASGKLRGFAKVTRDITEKQRTEEALRKSEESFRLLVSSVVDYAIVLLSPQGEILTWNEGAERIKGYKTEEILGQNFSLFFSESDIKRGVPERELKDATKKGHFEGRGWRVKKDGSLYFADVVITALRNNDGSLRGFAKVTRDITQRKKEEDELQEARDKAVEASRSKSEFLSHMSHEIRTPMNGIIGMTEILERSNLSEQQLKFALAIKEASHALLTVINDILDFSKIEAGKLDLESVDVEPVALIESIAELLSEPARKKEVPILTFIDPLIPPVIVSDPMRLRQILLNFVSNAIKFSDRGEVLIRSSLEKDEKDGRQTIKFSVTDQGPGLTQKQMAGLFQPFVQGDSSMTRKYGGTGLGLVICKQLVELMHGDIGVHSVRGHGSTFWFSVPLMSSPNAIRHKKKEMPLDGTRVLIVDDQKNARDILQNYLTHWGIRTETATNAGEALKRLKDDSPGDPFAAILIDLRMPDTDGLALGRMIRQDDQLNRCKMILTTAFDKPGIGQEAVAMGFEAYLTKPLRQSDLYDALAGVLHERQSQINKIGRSGPFDSDSEINTASSIKKSKGGNVNSESGLQTLPKRRELILVAEDHPVNQEVALILLRELGFEAHIAANGDEAISRLKRVPYSLVFMDCQMPVRSGLEATKIIRKSELRTGEHIPIVAMTAHAIDGSREQCIAAGMDDYVSKPISPQQLERVLARWLPESPELAQLTDDKISANWLDTLNNIYGPTDTEHITALFWDEAAKLLEQLEVAQETANRGKLLIAAVSLRGICETLFARDVCQLCSDLENAGQDEDWAVAANIISQLTDKLGAMRRIFSQSRAKI